MQTYKHIILAGEVGGESLEMEILPLHFTADPTEAQELRDLYTSTKLLWGTAAVSEKQGDQMWLSHLGLPGTSLKSNYTIAITLLNVPTPVILKVQGPLSPQVHTFRGSMKSKLFS